MKPSPAAAIDTALAPDLQDFDAICEEALALAAGESQALAGQADDYKPLEYYERRKRLLPKLELSLMRLRHQRQARRGTNFSEEIASLFQSIQCRLMKVLLLDRENQQALLRRGLVPPNHLPPVVAQRPHYVSGLYRQHAKVWDGSPV